MDQVHSSGVVQIHIRVEMLINATIQYVVMKVINQVGASNVEVRKIIVFKDFIL